MSDSVFDRACKGLFSFCKENATTILTIASSLGVVGTAILVAKETPKAMEDYKKTVTDDGKITKETVLAVGKDYLPSIATASATIACIISSNAIHNNEYADLLSGCGIMSSMFKDYRKEVVNRYGQEVDDEICEAIMQRSNNDYHWLDINYPDMKVYFHEPITDQYILCYERNMMDAEYHTERNLMYFGCLPFNSFLEMIGAETQEEFHVDNFFHPDTDCDADLFGWALYNGDYYWVNFAHIATRRKINGIPVFEIDYGDAWPDIQPEEEMI